MSFLLQKLIRLQNLNKLNLNFQNNLGLQYKCTHNFAATLKFDPNKNYYVILGVSPSATQKEIKAQYYKLAKQHHPDLNKDKGNDEYIKQINFAYQVVGNEENRKEYDNYRAGGMNPRGATHPSQRQYQAYQAQQNYNYTKTRKYQSGFGNQYQNNANQHQYYQQYYGQRTGQQNSEFYQWYKQNMGQEFDPRSKEYQYQEYNAEMEREILNQNLKKQQKRFIAFGIAMVAFWYFFEVLVYRIMYPKEYVIYDEETNTMYVTDEDTYKQLQQQNKIMKPGDQGYVNKPRAQYGNYYQKNDYDYDYQRQQARYR